MQTEQLNDDERKDIAAYIQKKKKNTYQLIAVVGIFLFIFALPMGIATETWCILSILSIILYLVVVLLFLVRKS